MDPKFKKDYQLIGTNIREKRKALKLTQEQLAKKSGPKVDYAKISDIERAKEDFQLSTLLKICSGLGMTLSELIAYEPTPKNQGKEASE